MRRSFDSATGKKAIHMVSAWGSVNGIVLGQVKTDAKSNEIMAIPKLLAMLDITGCTITIDAMGTQKEIAKQIIDQGGDYVLPVKDNHPNLRANIEAFFERVIANQFLSGNGEIIPHTKHRMFDADHGRTETRRCLCTGYLGDIQDTKAWEGIQSIAMIEAERVLNGKKSVERRYYITSLPPDAKLVNVAVRTHWGVENSLHWVLDVVFDEDRCRTRKDNGPQIRATLNRMAINICKSDTSRKVGIKN
jgi:predicted transposase YbfD/YdcC